MTFKNSILKAFEEFQEEYVNETNQVSWENELAEVNDRLDSLETVVGNLQDLIEELKEKLGGK